MFNNIEEALMWVMNRKKTHLPYKRLKKILNDLNNPQNDFYMIHVAGTNGKGSTVTFLRDLLMAYGLKVGTLQSPHYETHLDRIRLNGNNIMEEAFIRLLNKYYDLIIKEELSMFEIDYLIMCDYFKENNIDIAIVEVGLGGRLDSTNVIDKTKLSIITTIGYDHTEVLGDTLEKICQEKCGIIKNKSKTLVGKLDDNLKDIVKKECLLKNNLYYEIDDYIDLDDRKFIYKQKEYQLLSYAQYQKHNASIALEALEIIKDDFNIKIDYQLNYETLKNSLWKGRFELINEKPRIFLDGAHNLPGMKVLLEAIAKLNGKTLIIFSALKKKKYLEMIKMIKEEKYDLIITTFNFPKAIKKEDVKEYEDIFIDDYQNYIKDNMHKYDNIIICGSLYFLSEIVNNKRNSNLIRSH